MADPGVFWAQNNPIGCGLSMFQGKTSLGVLDRSTSDWGGGGGGGGWGQV